MTAKDRRRRAATWFHKRVANPLMRPLSRYVPGGAVLETIGRKSGLPRQTPVGGRIEGDCFWMVSDHGRQSQYVRNIEADARVRVRVGSRWRTGTAHLMPEDDPRQRLRRLPRANGLLVRLLGTDLLTIRVDLSPGESAPYGR
ncbi:nitroreductase/quinone reductase family protein [Actinomadura sp. DC4]|uniref:nitroreductase/quinone reductase family protein n=1 Tax=Actinomadura sp. DC4 TaxID=3055069 RepID=UPI0025B08C38|nr:nitroreductase/quinone reductase family protein [Actinomadura sp. DC4]MDN3351711.1 nitroreductase/quinone reductase family protein [Actinomadura sp. DC4]